MKVPTMLQDPLVGKDGKLSPNWQVTLDQLLQELQQNFGDLGIGIPPLSSDPDSVIPPTTGGQLGLIEKRPYKPVLVYDSFTDELKFRKPSGFVVIV